MNHDNGIAKADDFCVKYKESRTSSDDGHISMEISDHSKLTNFI